MKPETEIDLSGNIDPKMPAETLSFLSKEDEAANSAGGGAGLGG